VNGPEADKADDRLNLTRKRAAQRRQFFFKGQKARFRLICWAFPRNSKFLQAV
jgi:hypothetical protein